jgi:hypothetical protein
MLAQYPVTRLALATVEKYCTTMDTEIGPQHVPDQKGIDPRSSSRAELVDHILPIARRAWRAVLDPHNWTVSFSHSHYLKLWADMHPQVGAPGGYIMFDEAQDANPLLRSIVADQDHLQRIYVGDENQAIYCQPLGTMVEVPAPIANEFPAEDQCSFGPCDRRRNHKTSGLCHLHERQRRAGAQFDVAKRRNRAAGTQRVPIESLRPGDLVCTYSNTNVYMRGRPVKDVRRFRHEGHLVRVQLASRDLTSSYTPRHHCIVRIGRQLAGKHVVYLMRRGDQFRVGRVPMFYASQNGAFGLSLRSVSEQADSAWILSVHDSAADASLHEALIQARYSLPGVCFEDHKHQMDVLAFWMALGPNRKQAERCLRDHGRLVDFPLVAKGQFVGSKREFVTAAANLIDGMTMLPFDGAKRWKGKRGYVAPRDVWEPITATLEPYASDVVSIEVEDHHTYYADGILTHNSFTGAVNAMADIDGARYLSLTQSWRFGPAIADAANVYLGILGSKLRVRGNPGIDARIVDAAAPVDAVLCRTNGAALVELMEAQKAGKRTALIGDTETAVRFCESATNLKAGIAPRDSDLAAFGSWGELQEYVEHSPGAGDLKTLVELVDSHGVDAVRAAMESTVPPNRADLISATCHKVKGLEFQRVRINHQWEMDDGPTADPMARREEQMLAYVGLTRAKDQLDPGQLLTPAQALKINERYGHHLTPATMPPRMAGQLV